MTVTSRSANEQASGDFGLFCNPESRRVEGFCIALGRVLRRRPKLIPWQRVLAGPEWPQRLGVIPRFLRLESPGRNWRVEQQFLLHGATATDEEANRNWRQIPVEAVAALPSDPGRVLPMRQWFLGWRQTLAGLETWADCHAAGNHWLCPPADAVRMCDKLACHVELDRSGVPVPPVLGVPGCFDELWELMRQSGRRRIFLKPCHGSSASGVVALETNGREVQAFSTLELVEAPDGLRLYNRRGIRPWRGAASVRRLVDEVCRERCLAQVWIPKAGLSGRPFDLRIVVIGGVARHVMVRLGRGPMTNSQLLGGKGDLELLRRKIGEEAWREILAVCENAMGRCFPRSLYAGFDVLLEPDFRTAWILEVNAFGDLLPRILCEGRDTYTWEIEEALRNR